jgi:hypothetical protein
MNWTKPQRDKSKAEGKALFAYGYKGKLGGMELTGLMEDGLAANLFGFVMNIYKGVPPSQAFIDAGLDAHDPVPAVPTEAPDHARSDEGAGE